MGDLNGDGILDIVVGAKGFWANTGAVYILFLDTDGTCLSHQKISPWTGDFTGSLAYDAYFGASTSALGDLNGDGILDIVVGAHGDNTGAVFILFLESNGTCLSHQKISALSGNFTGSLADPTTLFGAVDEFGASSSALGDLNGDGIVDIVVGANGDGDGFNAGAAYIIFLDTDGTCLSHQKISAEAGGFTGSLAQNDDFGTVSSGFGGDLNGDSILDIVVGASGDDDGGFNAGAVYIMFLDTDGTCLSHQKISALRGGFTGSLDENDNFGVSNSGFGGDLNEDNILVVGASGDDYGSVTTYSTGASYVVFLDTDGTCLSHQKITFDTGGFTGFLNNYNYFGYSNAVVGDLNRGGIPDLVVGASGDDDGGDNTGAVYIVFLDYAPIPTPAPTLPPPPTFAPTDAPTDIPTAPATDTPTVPATETPTAPATDTPPAPVYDENMSAGSDTLADGENVNSDATTTANPTPFVIIAVFVAIVGAYIYVKRGSRPPASTSQPEAIEMDSGSALQPAAMDVQSVQVQDQSRSGQYSVQQQGDLVPQDDLDRHGYHPAQHGFAPHQQTNPYVNQVTHIKANMEAQYYVQQQGDPVPQGDLGRPGYYPAQQPGFAPQQQSNPYMTQVANVNAYTEAGPVQTGGVVGEVAVGYPAQVAGQTCKCGGYFQMNITESFQCSSCGSFKPTSAQLSVQEILARGLY